MTSKQLDEGLRWIWQEFYSKRSITHRLSTVIQREKAQRVLSRNGYLSTAEVLLALNAAFRVAVGDF